MSNYFRLGFCFHIFGEIVIFSRRVVMSVPMKQIFVSSIKKSGWNFFVSASFHFPFSTFFIDQFKLIFNIPSSLPCFPLTYRRRRFQFSPTKFDTSGISSIPLFIEKPFNPPGYVPSVVTNWWKKIGQQLRMWLKINWIVEADQSGRKS